MLEAYRRSFSAQTLTVFVAVVTILTFIVVQWWVAIGAACILVGLVSVVIFLFHRNDDVGDKVAAQALGYCGAFFLFALAPSVPTGNRSLTSCPVGIG